MADPDHVEDHKPRPARGKMRPLSGKLRGAESTGFEKRQVFDLPKEITIEVTEHRAETGICPCCSKKVKASFPEEVTAPVQYGERIQTLVIYLHTYQLLPCERLGEFFGDVSRLFALSRNRLLDAQKGRCSR
ncbi:MAG: IS66 family transposase zinc-finger binding domain-containing protein [Verrucomicrobiales bacterium]